MPRRNANALRTGLDVRDVRYGSKHPHRVKHRPRCNCRVCKRRRIREKGLIHLLTEETP